jgi:hypothetical protein
VARPNAASDYFSVRLEFTSQTSDRRFPVFGIGNLGAEWRIPGILPGTVASGAADLTDIPCKFPCNAAETSSQLTASTANKLLI